MKRFVKLISLVLVLATVLALPVWAQAAEPRASDYFASSNVYLYKTSSNQFQVCFSVTATGGMDELGVSTIKVQRSVDGENWYTMRTYTKEDYPSLIKTNTSSYATYVTYTATTGYYYRAKITLYATNDEGTGYLNRYTASLKL